MNMRFGRWLLAAMMPLCLALSATLPPAFAEVSCVAEVKDAPAHPGLIFHQYYLGCLSHASYLIGDESTKTAIVVDPQRDVDQYIEDAKKNGLKITQVFLTHVHADFVAGHLELQRRTGAEICLGAKAKAEFKFHPFKEGDKLDMGNAVFQVLETPGHTPEAISILVFDKKTSNDKPYAVLTGDALFIGDVGRPDLMSAQGLTAQELAGMEYDTLHNKFMTLPDETLVYPAHGAGSLCGRNLSKETVSTIGAEKKTNYAMQPMSKEKLVALLTANQPKAPKYFNHDANYNMTNHASLEDVLDKGLKPLSIEEALQLKNSGAYLLDGRESDAYAKMHVVDSINIPLKGRYATWAGTFIDHQKPVVVICEPGQQREAAMRLGRIGLDNVVGYVKGGVNAFKDRADLVRSNIRETPKTLVERMKSDNPPYVVDVRAESERQDAYVDGTVNVPLIEILENVDKLPKDKDLVIMCASGNRSSTAASLLSQLGVTRVTDLAGGIEAWQELKLPTKSIPCTLKSP